MRNHLYNRSNKIEAPDKKTLRIMARYEQGRDLNYIDIRSNSLKYGTNKKLNTIKEGASLYETLERRQSNNLENYRKSIKQKYAKKNCFYKLDCYCEQKIFNKIDHIYALARKFQNDKKSFRNVIFKKYGIGLILFTLFPLLGIIIPIYLDEKYIKNKKVPIMYGFRHGDLLAGDINKPFKGYRITGEISLGTWVLMKIINRALMFASFIIVLIIIIYILIKVVKYERIREGKHKMCVKEYCGFCKDVFI